MSTIMSEVTRAGAFVSIDAAGELRVERGYVRAEFKREAVAWETSGRLQTEVAAELGIMPTMLRRWQRKQQESSAWSMSPAAKPPVSSMASPADQASEIARLRRELDRARLERDILKSRRHPYNKLRTGFAEMPR